MREKEKKFGLQDRLIDYAVRIWLPSPSLVTNTLFQAGAWNRNYYLETKADKHISSQILKSGTSPTPNFIHKVLLATNSFFSHQFASFLGLKKSSGFSWLDILNFRILGVFKDGL